MSQDLLQALPGAIVPLSSLEELPLSSFRATIVDRVAAGARISAG